MCPILEYYSVVWSPWLKQDIDQIEKVKRLVRMKDLNYDERMHRLGLPSLELRAEALTPGLDILLQSSFWSSGCEH